jgi:spore germination protein KB
MIEKGKISVFQMAILMYAVVVATGDLVVPAVTARHAERDLWMVPIMSSFFGFFIMVIAYQLHKLYPGKTLIQYSEQIVGRFIGKTVSLIYIFECLKSVSIISRQYGEFIAGAFLPYTPRTVIIGSMIFVCAVAARLGIEAIARAAQIFVPLLILGWMIAIILLIPDMEINYMLPILEKGITPIIKGSISLSAWFLHFTTLTFLLPLLSDQKGVVKWGTFSVIAIIFTLVLLDLVTLFILGEITSSQTYPVMNAVKYIEVADFLEHLESIVMATWVAGAFVKISVYYYILIFGTAQWLGLSDYRPLSLPITLLAVSFSFWMGPSMMDISEFLRITNLVNNFTVKLGIPLLLLIIALIRSKFRKNNY